jgi:hypothetical protein
MRHHPALFAIAFTAISAAFLEAQPVLRPAPSSRATTSVSLQFPTGQAPEGAQPATIQLDYGQPHLRGRTLHTDSLAPYDRPWRTGANALTTLTTGVDLLLGGVTVPKGNYAIFTIPGRTGWKLILQRNINQSATEYDVANDVARIDLRRETIATPVESLTMWLIPSTAPGPARGELRMAWGNSMLSADWSVK